MSQSQDSPQTLVECEQCHRRLAELLASIGFIWPGTLQRRMLTCGKAQCACRKDPEARHGPYLYWTTKKQQKTVSRLLSEEEARIIEDWIGNRRTVEGILQQMNDVAQQALNLLLQPKSQAK